ncbi:cytochrome P450 [Tessaracoccus oleiagri]|uniref:Cytochrome P450 n=1 Tax=Tessaracoccus oleiagri TaxID=686624 RepID=A0A1G9JES1_9ACTN|nr:cytochrome P450 [Tessaracoccus oleiagri]SDL35792.1 Cytochrome P450 [Tessaracoccus oleiagri]
MTETRYDAHNQDIREFTDAIRPTARVVRNVKDEWILLGHEEVVAAATDPETFSSRVSAHLQLPNGLDGDEHRRFRALIDRYLSHDRMVELEPLVAEVAEQTVAELPADETVDAVRGLGATFAVRAMTRWLGWPEDLHPTLVQWVIDNQHASASGDREQTAKVAADFDGIIASVIAPRRADPSIDDVTAELVRDDFLGRPLEDAELVSILRNWTGGDLGSMALCIGVVLEGLVRMPRLAERIRSGSDAEVEAIIAELLRIDNPFVSNRRVTTCPVTVAGVDIPEGARVRLNWTSANRDEATFGQEFDEVAHAEDNLVFGVGPHYCPGEELSLLELRVLFRALLRRFETIELAGAPKRAVTPVGGYDTLPVIFR